MSMILRPSFLASNPIPTRKRHKPRPRPTPRPRPNPRDAWPAEADQRWTIATPPAPGLDLSALALPMTVVGDDQAEGPRPTAAPEAPSPAAVAWNDGYGLGYDQEVDAIPPAELPEALSVNWWHGRNTGWLARERDDLVIDRRTEERRDEAFTLPGDGWHEAERVEAVGAIVARLG